MIESLSNYQNVSSFITFENLLLVNFKSNELIKVKDQQKEWQINIAHSPGELFFGNKTLCLLKRYMDASLVIIEFENGELIGERFDYQFTSEMYGSAIGVGCLNYETAKFSSGIYDLEEQKLLWINESFSLIGFVGGMLFDRTDNIIKHLKVNNGIIIWQTDLSPYGTIAQLIGTSNGILWVSLHNQIDIHCLLGIDIHTGNIVHSGDHLAIKSAFAVNMSEDKTTILCMHGINHLVPETAYKEVDAATGKVLRHGVVDAVLQEGLVVKFWQRYGDKIYFTACKGELFPKYVGIMDYATLTLLDYTKVSELPGRYLPAGQPPRVADKKMYVLDITGTLHVFEIE